MDQPPSTSPELPALSIRHFYFHHPKYQPPSLWPPFLAPVLGAVIVFLILGCLAFRHIFRSSETPAAAPPPQPLPADDTTSSSEAASADSEGATDTSLQHEVELMLVQPPVFSCPICKGPLVREVATECGHIFCKVCIKAAVRARGKCPTCRAVLTMRELRRVYLPSTH